MERLRTEFFDVGAVVYSLRKAVWTVPGFTVDAHRDGLRAMHGHIEREGSFPATTTRFLTGAREPR